MLDTQRFCERDGTPKADENYVVFDKAEMTLDSLHSDKTQAFKVAGESMRVANRTFSPNRALMLRLGVPLVGISATIGFDEQSLRNRARRAIVVANRRGEEFLEFVESSESEYFRSPLTKEQIDKCSDSQHLAADAMELFLEEVSERSIHHENCNGCSKHGCGEVLTEALQLLAGCEFPAIQEVGVEGYLDQFPFDRLEKLLTEPKSG